MQLSAERDCWFRSSLLEKQALMERVVTHHRYGSCEMLRRIGYICELARQVRIHSTSTFPIWARPKDPTRDPLPVFRRTSLYP